MADVRISLQGDQRRLQKLFKLMPGEIERISKKSINEVTDKYTRQLGGEIPRDAGTSVTGYRRVRSKKKRAKGRKRIRAQIWQGSLRIPARYAGRMKAKKGGVQAGRHFFPGAFIATMSNGYRGVFTRKGRDSYPIEQEFVYLDNAASIVRRNAADLNKDLRQLIEERARKSLRKVTA